MTPFQPSEHPSAGLVPPCSPQSRSRISSVLQLLVDLPLAVGPPRYVGPLQLEASDTHRGRVDLKAIAEDGHVREGLGHHAAAKAGFSRADGHCISSSIISATSAIRSSSSSSLLLLL